MEKAFEIAEFIWLDMQEPISYIPQGLLWGAVPAFCVLLFLRLSGRRRGLWLWAQVLLIFLLGLYFSVMLEQSFFSRPPGSRTTVNMQILGTWRHGAQGRAYVIENFLMFIPFGFLLPAAFRRLRSVFSVVPLAFMCSACLEYVQFLTERGHAQADDVLMNTLGAAAGYLIFLLTAGLGGLVRKRRALTRGA